MASQEYKSIHSGAEIDAAITAVPNKVDKILGKGLSEADFTTAEKAKLSNLTPSTTEQVNTGTDNVSYITPLRLKERLDVGFGTAAERDVGTGINDLPDNTQLNTRLGTTGNFTGLNAVNGLAKGNGTGGYSSAVANTDYLPVNSPNMTGVPTVPTAALGTDTTQAASTGFVQNAFDELADVDSEAIIAGVPAKEYKAPFKSLAIAVTELTSAYEDRAIQWRGYFVESDGGSGWGFVRVGAYTADGGSIIAVGPNLYIEQNLKGKTVNVRKFGARVNKIADDTIPLQNCINYCAPYTWKGSVVASRIFDPVKSEVFIPSGGLRVTEPVLLSPFMVMGGLSAGGFFGENNSTIWADFDGPCVIDAAPFVTGGTRPIGQTYVKENFDGTPTVVSCPGWTLKNLTILPMVDRSIDIAVNRTASMQSHMKKVGIEGRESSSFIGKFEVGVRTNLCWGGSIKSCHIVANTYALENNGDVTVDYQTGNYLVALGTDSTYANLDWPDDDDVKAMTASVFNRFASPTLIGNTYEGGQIGIKSCRESQVLEHGGFFESCREYAFAFHTVSFDLAPKWLLVPKKVMYKKDATGSLNVKGSQYFQYLAGSFMDEVTPAPLYIYAPIAIKEHYASIVYPELHASECNVYASSSGSDSNSGYRADAPVLTLQEAALRCASGKKSKINLLSNIATKYNVAGSNTTLYSFDNIGDLTIGGNGFTLTVSQSSNQCHALRVSNVKLVTEDLNISLPTVSLADQRAFIRPSGTLNALLRNTDVTGTGNQSALFGSQDGVGGFLSVNILDSALSNFKLVQDTLPFTSSALMWTENNSGTTWSSVVTDSSQKIKSKQFV
jgi:hypothetical protein